MRVQLWNQDGVVGEVTVVAGLAVPSNDLARRTIEETSVVLPGHPPERVEPEDGERYLRALSASLRGSYFWAELVVD